MPGTVRPVIDERDALLAFLAQQRDALRIAAYGLTDAEAVAAPSASALSVGGLIKHVADVEWYWINVLVAGRPMPQMGEQDYEGGFRLQAGETLASVLEHYAAVAAETEAIIGAISDMGQPVPVPKGVPWFPQDVEAWSVRWVLLHLIEETARHAGHADVVRESLDGATFYPLMAAVEGWQNDWITPWKPASAAGEPPG